MEKSSYFIKEKALFGGYPSQENVDFFESINVKYFVDLTSTGEKHIIPYKTNYEYLNYPILDGCSPKDWDNFAQFIYTLSKIIANLGIDEKIYIHCKGGHGRAGVVVACLLCHIYKLKPFHALVKTKKYHNNRVEMREKWRRLGSPQTKSQKNFVYNFFNPLYIYKN
jgi:protein-tyrosine phosphatase